MSVHHVEHGSGPPVVVLHGAGVDHRETEACFEPALDDSGLRRIYPDLPGSGHSPADGLSSGEDVLAALLAFAVEATRGAPYLLVGHSVGGHYAVAMAERHPDRVAGLALVCPLLPGIRDVPEHRAVSGEPGLGDEEFRGYFVEHTPAMLERHERYVAGAALDADALERIGECGELAPHDGPPYDGPTLVVAGRLDATVGHARGRPRPPAPARHARRRRRHRPRAAARASGAAPGAGAGLAPVPLGPVASAVVARRGHPTCPGAVRTARRPGPDAP